MLEVPSYICPILQSRKYFSWGKSEKYTVSKHNTSNMINKKKLFKFLLNYLLWIQHLQPFQCTSKRLSQQLEKRKVSPSKLLEWTVFLHIQTNQSNPITPIKCSMCMKIKYPFLSVLQHYTPSIVLLQSLTISLRISMRKATHIIKSEQK